MPAVTRRTVLLAAPGAALLAGCSAEERPQPAAAAPGGPLVALSDVPVGGAVAVTTADGQPALVVRPSEGEARAYSAVCPHQGCTVAPEDERLACPCHGSAFDLAGEVLQGPADRALTPLPVRVEGGQVLPA